VTTGETLRHLCLGLPGATEVAMRRGPTYRVNNKIFACDRLIESARTLWCKAPEGGQAHLVAADPQRFFSPPYFGPKGWIGMRLDGADWGEVERLVRRSHALVGKGPRVADT
jgi:hypothetical protein